MLNALFTSNARKILAEIENLKGRIFKLPAPKSLDIALFYKCDIFYKYYTNEKLNLIKSSENKNRRIIHE